MLVAARRAWGGLAYSLTEITRTRRGVSVIVCMSGGALSVQVRGNLYDTRLELMFLNLCAFVPP